MKKLMHKNQVIITALAIMIAVAGYLNFSDKSMATSQTGEVYEAENIAETDEFTLDIADDEDEYYVNDNVIVENEEIIEDVENVENKEIEEAKEYQETISDVDYTDTDSTNNVGEAVLVNSTISLNYFYTAKLNREQSRAKNKEELLNIVENNNIDEEQKQAAVNEIIELTSISEKENSAELLLEARGFENAVVSVAENTVDVIVDADTITSEQVAQIEDIVSRKTNISAENIVITPVSSKE